MSKAVAACGGGEIQRFDRVDPWDIAAVRTIKGVKMENLVACRWSTA